LATVFPIASSSKGEVGVSPNHDAASNPTLHRRSFAHAALATAVAAAVVAAPTQAQEPKSEEKISLSKATEAIVRQRYGEHLTEEQIKRVVQRAQGRFSSRPKQETPLHNSDEPAFVFQADV
jgi:hypothetical protein